MHTKVLARRQFDASCSNQYAHPAQEYPGATDFSQASKLALPYAIALAGQYDAKLFIAHAISPEPHFSVSLDPLPVEADPVFVEAERTLPILLVQNCFVIHHMRKSWNAAIVGT